MNQEEVTRMAREAGVLAGYEGEPDNLIRFAALVAEREREECAAICDKCSEFCWSWWEALADPLERAASDAADGLAQCIRNRT